MPKHCAASDAPALSRFRQKLRDYQQDVIDDALTQYALDPHGRTLYASPTATGKGTVELGLLKTLRERNCEAWILTPSLEVLRGFLERCGADRETLEGASGDKLAAMGEAIYVTTPVRLRNRVLDGSRGMPEVVIYDEVHHAVADNEVSGTLFAIAPDACWFGFTATPFRGSPRSTKALREAWGEPIVVYTIPEAAEDGWLTLPTFEVVPLVDDDKVKVVNGKFVVKSANKETKSRIDALADLVRDRLDFDEIDSYERDPLAPLSIVPTVVTVPSSDVASWLVSALDRRGILADWVSAKTPARERAAAYRRCELGQSVLVSIAVLTEGVDLPWLKRLIDARPLLSPVAWVQQIGRIMRNKVDGSRGEYICTNRNLERHAYLLQGALPREKFAEAQAAFEKPSDRDNKGRVGLEAMRRFKAIPLPLAGGSTGFMFNVWSVDSEGVKTEYVSLLDPVQPEPITACRTIPRLTEADGDRVYDYKAAGRWTLCQIPDDLTGFATSGQKRELSDPMLRWWKRSARRHGLDPDADINRRQFAALPVLSDLRGSL